MQELSERAQEAVKIIELLTSAEHRCEITEFWLEENAAFRKAEEHISKAIAALYVEEFLEEWTEGQGSGDR